MTVQAQRGFGASLWAASRLGFVVPSALLMGFLALLVGHPLTAVGIAAVTVLVGQLLLAWAGSAELPERGFAVTLLGFLLIPIAISNGIESGIAYLLSIGAAGTAYLGLERTRWSPLPWAVSYGLLPAFLSYGGDRSAPPTIAITVLAALLGVGVHFAQHLRTLVEDDEAGLRHLPLRLALRMTAQRLLWLTATYLALVLAGFVVILPTIGFRRG
jgi:hypothetical protein